MKSYLGNLIDLRAIFCYHIRWPELQGWLWCECKIRDWGSAVGQSWIVSGGSLGWFFRCTLAQCYVVVIITHYGFTTHRVKVCLEMSPLVGKDMCGEIRGPHCATSKAVCQKYLNFWSCWKIMLALFKERSAPFFCRLVNFMPWYRLWNLHSQCP